MFQDLFWKLAVWIQIDIDVTAVQGALFCFEAGPHVTCQLSEKSGWNVKMVPTRVWPFGVR